MGQPLWLLLPTVVLRGERLAVLLLLPLSALVLAAVSAGRLAPVSAAGLEAGACAPPCWQGLRLGEMTEEEALEALEGQDLAAPGSLVDLTVNSSRLLAVYEFRTRRPPVYTVEMRFFNDRLLRLDLRPEGQVLLGEVLTAFGPPSHAYCQNSSRLFTAILYFYEGTVEVWALIPLQSRTAAWQVSPEMRVLRITYHAESSQAAGIGPLAADLWRGFGRVNPSGFCR